MSAAKKIAEQRDGEKGQHHVTLTATMSKKSTFVGFDVWIVGRTPLIVHAWSEKARRQLLGKHVKAIRGEGKEIRDPKAEYQASIYEMPGGYGFPSMAFKKAIQEAGHKDKGIAKTAIKKNLWFNADIVSVRPALAGAICDMPLIRLYGSKPQMREDMVKIGSGINKVANLAYRAQFSTWAVHLSGEYNAAAITPETLTWLISEAGLASGVGEWRNEKDGVFGSFEIAQDAEKKAWADFAVGKGPLPAKSSETRLKIAAE